MGSYFCGPAEVSGEVSAAAVADVVPTYGTTAASVPAAVPAVTRQAPESQIPVTVEEQAARARERLAEEDRARSRRSAAAAMRRDRAAADDAIIAQAQTDAIRLNQTRGKDMIAPSMPRVKLSDGTTYQAGYYTSSLPDRFSGVSTREFAVAGRGAMDQFLATCPSRKVRL
jgi:hypothetical protein